MSVMACGHGLFSSRNCRRILFIYLVSLNYLHKTGSSKPLSGPTQQFYSSIIENAVKIDGLPYHRRRSTMQTSFPNTLKVKAVCRLTLNSCLVIILIELSNDVESQPGPVVTSGVYSKIPSLRGFKVGHLNVRSLVHKMDAIKILILENKLDVFTCSETWLNDKISDAEIGIPGYSLTRSDRENGKRGGGTVIYVKDGVPYKPRKDFISKSIETCWIEIDKPKAKTLFICSSYKPPSVSLDDSIRDLEIILSNFPSSAEYILLGDFNVNELSTRKDRQDYASKQKLKQFALKWDLVQLIKDPTRVTETSKSIIDLIFVSNPRRITVSGVINADISDHHLVFCNIKSGVPRGPPRMIESRSYRSYNKNAFINELRESDLNNVVDCEDVDIAVQKWTDIFSAVANNHAPIKRSRIKGIQIPWLNTDLKEAMRKRDFHHRKAVKCNSREHWAIYREMKSHVNKAVKRRKSSYYKDLIEENKGNPSELWKTINEITARKSHITPTCITSNGVCHTSPSAIAEIFNNYFATIGTKLIEQIKSKVAFLYPSVRHQINDESQIKFGFQPLTISSVANHLLKLKTNKAFGLDKIGSRLLKDSAYVIAPSLTKIFNLSITSSKFPTAWKLGRVTPIFKKGDRTNPNNFRPITILPTLSKVLERLMHNQIYNFLHQNNKLTSKQYGFRPRLSTETALTQFTDEILLNMDSGHITGAVFLDLAKAFDTVDHSLLLLKLSALGLNDATVEWFTSYLSERSQVTMIDHHKSSSLPVPVGVPQGSILGPLLFIVFVNDLPSCIRSCDITLYADDTVLYYSSSSLVDLEEKINGDLEHIADWFNKKILTLNDDKTEFILIGSPYKLKNCSDVSIVINDKCVNLKDSIKYLGVTINRNLTWSDHIEEIKSKVNQRIGLLRRVGHLVPLSTRLTLYNSLILPVLDYADIIWGDKENKTLMEDVQLLQNKAAKVILRRPILSSASAALCELKWKPLLLRRQFRRCVFFYKCTNNLINFNLNVIENTKIHNYNTRQCNDLHLPLPRTKWGKQRIAFQGSKEWNAVNIEIRNSDSLLSFKRKLNAHS